MEKATNNCWTCKERKVGCDRLVPTCANCRRSSRECQGYGLRLAWPDKVDGRRKQKEYLTDPSLVCRPNSVKGGDGGFVFLNTTFDDLKGGKIDLQRLTRSEQATRPLSIAHPISIVPGFETKDGYLLSYYDEVLARMITTIDDSTNGFRQDLIPMALSSDAGSQSLLQATLALSSHHLGREKDALRYKARAITSLSEAFRLETTDKISLVAACMMLCVYSVFDVSDSTWHLHLQGAKSVATVLTDHERARPSFGFLSSWLAYHDTLSSYSHSINSRPLDDLSKMRLPEDGGKIRTVVGSLGCSSELLRLISCINQMRTSRDVSSWSPSQCPAEAIGKANEIRDRLRSLKQEIHITDGEAAGSIDLDRITLTAEFYRIGALLYLEQVAPRRTKSAHDIQCLVNDGFAILDQLELCTSPWPLFILGCNVASDIDRLKTLHIFDAMDQKRRIGNYQIIRGLLQAVWRRQDLGKDEKLPEQVDWRLLIDPGSSIPSFI